MNKYVKLAKKIQSMTAKEIVLAMVDSLRHPVTDEVFMDSFGGIGYKGCYGCAATNWICKIGEFNPNEELEGPRKYIIPQAGDNFEIVVAKNVIGSFETAIDCLRQGDIENYNCYAKTVNVSTIDINPKNTLPYLDSNNYLPKLEVYEDFAELL
jgi:hypothetical protein